MTENAKGVLSFSPAVAPLRGATLGKSSQSSTLDSRPAGYASGPTASAFKRKSSHETILIPRPRNRGSDELTLFLFPWDNARMIDLQTSATVERQNHRPCHSPSPWGEGRDEGELNLRERSERHFLRSDDVAPERSLDYLSGYDSTNRPALTGLVPCRWFKRFLFKASQGHSTLLKGIKAYSSIFKKVFFFFFYVPSGCRISAAPYISSNLLRLFKTL